MTKPFTCPKCSVGFSSKNSYNHHREAKHRRPYSFKCSYCPKRCGTSSNLRRHEKTKHMPFKYICTFCGIEVRSAYFLNRHIKLMHANEEPASYYCSDCKKKFVSLLNLNRHFDTVHRKADPQECSTCHAKFVSKTNLKRHIKDTHESVNCQNCNLCGKTFTNSQSLHRHQICIHSEEFNSYEYFECHHCALRCGRKDALIAHLKDQHADLYPLDPQFACQLCNKWFPVKRKLLSHLRRIHVASKGKDTKSVKCVLCSVVRTWKADLLVHYTDEHNIIFEEENLLFNRFDEFETWKKEMERSTVSQFNRVSTIERKTKPGSVFVYTCHRSGVPSSKSDDRKRVMKECGSKKVNGICPAEIRVTVKDDGACDVSFRKTHLGHSLVSVEEMQHLYLSAEERRIIASKIAAGIPFEKILEETRTSNNSRLNLLTRHDLSNIAASFNVKNSRRLPFGENPPGVDEFVRENRASILFYKPSNESDHTFGIFEDEDFVLIIMTDIQKKLLKQHGHKLIALDGTKGVVGYDFVLHSILVSDDKEIGIAVAFALSSRNDQNVIDILLICLREQVGMIETTTLISDMEDSHYDSWIQVMGRPKHRVYSTWHVRDNWRRKLAKITDVKKRSAIKNRLIEISEELDETTFKRELNEFISNGDPELENFLDDFEKCYMHNVECWAYCYRASAGINTNIDLQSFHSLIKYSLGLGGIRRIKRLVDCLDVLNNYLALGENDIQLEGIRRLTKKLQTLQQRHESAVKRVENPLALPIERVDVGKWQVASFTESDENIVEMYVVEKITPPYHVEDDEECELLCTQCEVCSHVYSCSCTDYCIQGNMCKHIHSLALFFKYFEEAPPTGNSVPLSMADLSEDDSTVVEEIEIDIDDSDSVKSLTMEDELPSSEIVHSSMTSTVPFEKSKVLNTDSPSEVEDSEIAVFPLYEFSLMKKENMKIVSIIDAPSAIEEVELVTVNNEDLA